MADLATLRTWLEEAEAARHALATGQSVVEVTRAGRKMAFTKASLPDLTSYICELNASIAAAEAVAAGSSLPPRRSIGVIFGG